MIQRKKKKNDGFIWLVCIEKNNIRSFFTFEFAPILINKETDKIIGVNIIEGNKDSTIIPSLSYLTRKME